jgi:aromatic ring-cleaving dioxygenase
MLLLCLLLSILNIIVYSHEHIRLTNTLDCNSADISDNIVFLSYHIHLIFNGTNETDVNGAVEIQKKFIQQFGNPEIMACYFEPKDVDVVQYRLCSFPIVMVPAGPFYSAQWSFFIPNSYYAKTVQWIMHNRGNYSSFVHPNSGCSTNDHTIWPLCGGSITDVNITNLSS